MVKCPQNHDSDSADFCSVCGVEIAGSPATAKSSATQVVQTGADRCPDCDTPREGPRQTFCEVCGYNYRTKASGVPPVAETPAPEEGTRADVRPKSKATMPAPVRPSAAAAARWDVEVQVDGALYGKPTPDAPVQQPKQTFPLFDAETLIGRAGTEVRVQVPVRDPGASRRQALLLLRDGNLFLRDLNSANGTQLNGHDVTPGVDTPVHDGDSISVGAWTRLTVRALSAPAAEEGRS